MKLFNNSLKVILCLVLVHLSLACSQDKKKRTRPATWRSADKNVNESIDSAALTGDISGVVVGNFNNISNDSLEQSTKAFATAFMEDPNSASVGLGSISSVYQNLNESGSTGVRFSLNICSQNNKITSNLSSGVIDGGAAVKLYIKDSLAALDDGNFGVLEVGGYSLLSQKSSFNNKNIRLVFSNSFGEITINGSFAQDAQWLVGQVSFNNNVDLTSDLKPFTGDLGLFYMPMADISRNCN